AVFLLRERLKPSRPLVVAALGLCAFEMLAWGPFLHSQTVNEFLDAPATGVLLLGLWNSDLDRVMAPVKKAATLLGRVSYPLFLMHWTLGGLVISLVGVRQGNALLALTGALSLVLSLL